ncbi:Na+/H+ antiporter NhaA [Streptomyces sp. 2P-4]|uniref:Na+/H+ antiporter NhaA n=1 Tax=Streptomyces sp. 2P-4 TaxID=2931974 RepID=UPI0032EB7178
MGVLGGGYLAARFTRARLNPELEWSDVFGLAALAGIGFTIALLFSELAFPGSGTAERVKAAVLIASVTSAAVAGVVLRRRNAVYRRMSQEEEGGGAADEDASGSGRGNGN